MSACVKRPDIRWIMCLVTAVVMLGCDRPANDRYFDLQQVEARWSNGVLQATVKQKLTLSAAAMEALKHGVPLTLQIEMYLRNTSEFTRVKTDIETWEVRYLPLSNHYQLTLPGGDEIRTFPRLRHLLADLSTVRLSFHTGVLPAGSYELLTRIRMDKRNFPPPMRLPTLFSSEWRHDSDWSVWPVGILPQA